MVFLNSWICRTGSDSMSVSSRDSIWGSMLTYVDICLLFFFNMMLKKYWYFMGTSKLGGKYGSICGQYLWPDLGARSRLPICSTLDWNSSFGNCRRMSEHGVVKGFEQPFTIKNQNTQLNKKTSVTGKTHNGQKKCRYGFQVYIYIHSESSTPTIPRKNENLLGR